MTQIRVAVVSTFFENQFGADWVSFLERHQVPVNDARCHRDIKCRLLARDVIAHGDAVKGAGLTRPMREKDRERSRKIVPD